MSSHMKGKRKSPYKHSSDGNGDSDAEEFNLGIPANDLRHKIGRQTSNHHNGSKYLHDSPARPEKRIRRSSGDSPSKGAGAGDGKWKHLGKHSDRRIVVNKDVHKRRVVMASDDDDDGSSEGGGSRQSKNALRSVIVKRDSDMPPLEDADMPSLEDDDDSRKYKFKNSDRKGKGNSAKAVRLMELKKMHSEKKEADKRKQEKIYIKAKSGKISLYKPPHRREHDSDEHLGNDDYSDSEKDSQKRGQKSRDYQIENLRTKIAEVDELVRQKKETIETGATMVQKDAEILRLRKKIRPSSEGIASNDSEMLRHRSKSSTFESKESEILRLREKSRAAESGEANTSCDKEMLRQRTKAQQKNQKRVATESDGANTSSDTEMLRQRTKAQQHKSETVASDDSEVLRIRRNQSNSSLGELDAVATTDSDILRIRRNLSNPDLEGSADKKTKGSSKKWKDLVDEEESQSHKRRTKSRGRGVSAVYRIPELEEDDADKDDLPTASRSEPRKHKFKFGAGESSPSRDRLPVKQRLGFISSSSGDSAKTKRSEWAEKDKGKTRYEMYKQESRKTLPENFQEAANSWRKQMNSKKSGKRGENNIWGRQSSAKETAAQKDHNDPSLSYQERLDALRSKCSHLYTKPGGNSSGGMSSISWNTGNWRAKFQQRYQNLPKVPYVDTHCHIDFLFQRTSFNGSFNEYLEENSETVPETFAGCVAVFCNPSTYFSEKDLFLDLMDEANIHGAVGVHPKSAGDFNNRVERQMRWMLDHEKVVALGEIGLDYSGTFYQEAGVQKRVFIRQLKMAEELNLPIVIHCRDAEEDCVEILEQNIDRHHVIHRHCWTGSWEECEVWMDKFPNSFIGLTPLVTHTTGRAMPVREVAARLPLDRLLLETDAPYFVPSMIPKEAMKFTHPALAITVASEVAELQDVPIGVVLKAVAQNTYRMYGFKPEL